MGEPIQRSAHRLRGAGQSYAAVGVADPAHRLDNMDSFCPTGCPVRWSWRSPFQPLSVDGISQLDREAHGRTAGAACGRHRSVLRQYQWFSPLYLRIEADAFSGSAPGHPGAEAA